MTVLAEHVDQPHNPDQRHRLTALDPRRLRCHDCDRTILLTQPSQSTSTSQTVIPQPKDPRCPQHPFEHAGNCRSCAAETKADEHRELVHQPTADVHTRADEARAALPTRRPSPTRTPVDDDTRMVQARAEVAARDVIPQPQPEPESSST